MSNGAPLNREFIAAMSKDRSLQEQARNLFNRTCEYRYSYNFTWLGRPIIQYPQDVVAIQELIWLVKPDVVIETGVAHGGSLILSASILELIGGPGAVIGVDIEIRPHNRKAIEEHPLSRRITMIEGSSVDSGIVQNVRKLCIGKHRPLVILDSNHTHEHVLQELRLYSDLVRQGSYVIVFDTVIEDMPQEAFPNRPWGIGNNPKTAVHEFLESNDRFTIDKELEAKLLFTVAPDGYLKCIKD